MPASNLTHAWIWAAIDELARRNDLSPSGLARLAGLDPTSLNRSKRTTGDGRLRWPSTESIAKILDATDTPLNVFAELQVSLVESKKSGDLNTHAAGINSEASQDASIRNETEKSDARASAKHASRRA